ncbi:unnamed protein product [Amoebophrya sp. A25]|nr:unnamed protein product [Amoebophrya sp. A25]|eukprot:GSA25T00024992001.1
MPRLSRFCRLLRCQQAAGKYQRNFKRGRLHVCELHLQICVLRARFICAHFLLPGEHSKSKRSLIEEHAEIRELFDGFIKELKDAHTAVANEEERLALSGGAAPIDKLDELDIIHLTAEPTFLLVDESVADGIAPAISSDGDEDGLRLSEDSSTGASGADEQQRGARLRPRTGPRKPKAATATTSSSTTTTTTTTGRNRRRQQEQHLKTLAAPPARPRVGRAAYQGLSASSSSSSSTGVLRPPPGDAVHVDAVSIFSSSSNSAVLLPQFGAVDNQVARSAVVRPQFGAVNSQVVSSAVVPRQIGVVSNQVASSSSSSSAALPRTRRKRSIEQLQLNEEESLFDEDGPFL